MHFTNIIISIVCLLTSIVYSIPTFLESESLKDQIDLFVESNFNDHEVGLYYEVMDLFDEGLDKRDTETEQTIGNILLSVNQSGIIWDLLDSIADSPSRVEWLTNLTNNLLVGQNITLSLTSLTSTDDSNSLLGSLFSQLNTSAIYNAIESSGLVESLADGLLLDTSFRPYLVDLIDRIVLSQKNVLLYIFFRFISKRDLVVDEDLFKRAETQSINTDQLASLFAAASAEQNSQTQTQSQSINTAQLASLFAAASAEQASSTTGTPSRPTGQNSQSISSQSSSATSALSNIVSRASASSSIESASRSTGSSSLSGTVTTSSNAFAGSLATFAANAGGAVVSSPIVGSIAEDFLNALNDTGFAVYFVKRFIATESYVNLTGELINTVLNSGAIHLDFSGLNISSIVDDALSDPTAIVTFVGSLLSGDSSLIQTQIATYWGKYGGALQSILNDLEAKGLFAELNNYIFGSGSTSVSASPTATVSTSSQGSTQISASVSTQNREVVSTSSSIQSQPTNTQTKSTNSGSNLNSFIYIQTFIFGAIALIFI